MWFETLSTSPVVLAIGWTLLHFLWQGTLIAGSVALALVVLRKRSAAVRYLVCCVGLAAMIITPLVTLFVELRHDALSSAGLGLLSALDPRLLSRSEGLTRVLPAFVAVWLVGAFLFQGRLFLHWLGARALRHREARPAPARVQSMVAELADRLGVRRSVLALESGLARVPAVMGWLRPVVLLPSGVLTGLTPQQLRAVLAHELAHVARHDYLVNLAQGVIEALLFYHPATWWLGHSLRTLREYCCDDVSVELCGDAMCFARALSSLGELADEPGGIALSSAATLGATGGSPMDRISRLFGMPVAETQRPAVWAAPLALTIALSGTAALALPAPAGGVDDETPKANFVVKLHRTHDIVDLAESVDARSGEILVKLREAGASDDMLLAVLMELNPTNQRVMDAAHKTLRHEQELQAKLAREFEAAQAEIERAVLNGNFSREEGVARLETIQRKLSRALQDRSQGQLTVHVTRDMPFGKLHRAPVKVEFSKEVGESHAVHENEVFEFKQAIDRMSKTGAELEHKLLLIEEQLVEATDAPARVKLDAIAGELRVQLEALRGAQHGTMRHLEHVLQEDNGHGDHLVELIAEVHEPHGNEHFEGHLSPIREGGDSAVYLVNEAGQHEVILRIIEGEMEARGLNEVEIKAAVERIHGQQRVLHRVEQGDVAAQIHEVRQVHEVLTKLDHKQLIDELRQRGLTEEQIKAEVHNRRKLHEKLKPRDR